MKGKHGKREAPHRKKRIKWLAAFSKQQKLLLAIAILLTVAVTFAVAWKSLFVKPELPGGDEAGGGTQTTQRPEIDYGDGIRPKASGTRKSEDFYTVLVLGRDTGGGGNTDTMLLASYDVTNQKATVMSIPRDTMVNVNWDVKKINSVYNMTGGGDKGVAAVYKEISQLVGFEPDYQVIVEWDSIGKLVDAIGGVYFDVPYPMDYHDPYQDLVIEQEAGYRLLDGEDAMQVIRWRKNDKDSPYGYTNGIGDSGRMQIQQDFLKAVIKQMMTPQNVLNIGKISKVFQESVETDLSFQNILWFGKQAFSGGLQLSDVSFVTMPWSGAEVFSRLYSKEFDKPFYLAYVVPQSRNLLELVNTQLSPFEEEFTLADLDIMYVNQDGSIGSTSGYVEDSVAAQPPDLSPYETQDPENNYMIDENGNVIDPETGEIIEMPGELDPNDPSAEQPGEIDPDAPPIERPGGNPTDQPNEEDPVDPPVAEPEEDPFAEPERENVPPVLELDPITGEPYPVEPFALPETNYNEPLAAA